MVLEDTVRRSFETIAITVGLGTAFYGAYDAQSASYYGTFVSLAGTFAAVGGAVSRSWRIQDAARNVYTNFEYPSTHNG